MDFTNSLNRVTRVCMIIYSHNTTQHKSVDMENDCLQCRKRRRDIINLVDSRKHESAGPRTDVIIKLKLTLTKQCSK